MTPAFRLRTQTRRLRMPRRRHRRLPQLQHRRRDVPIHQVIGRARLEAHAPITYQRHIVLLTVATVAAGMTAAPSMIGQSMEWQQMMLVVAGMTAAPSMIGQSMEWQ